LERAWTISALERARVRAAAAPFAAAAAPFAAPAAPFAAPAPSTPTPVTPDATPNAMEDRRPRLWLSQNKEDRLWLLSRSLLTSSPPISDAMLPSPIIVMQSFVHTVPVSYIFS
jgi:hypothetical protein